MADNVVIRAIVRDEASRKLERIEGHVEDLGDAERKTARDTDDLGRSFKRTDRHGRGLTKTLRNIGGAGVGLRTIFSAIKIPLYIGLFKLATQAVFALGAGVIALTGHLGRMIGVLGALPGAITALISVIGVLKLGTAGIGEAVKVLTTAGATTEQIQEAMQGLGPDAQRFARFLASLKPQFDRLRGAAQAGLIPGLHDAIERLVPLLPMVRRQTHALAQTIGELASRGARLVSSGPFRRDVNRILDQNRTLVATLGEGLIHLVSAIRHIIIAAGPLTQRLAEMATGWARWLNGASAAGRESGRLQAFFDRAGDSLRTWLNILRDFTMGLVNMMVAGRRTGDDLAGSLERLAARFRAWTGSARGQRRITRWFEEARPILRELGLLLGAMATTLFGISEDGKSGLADFFKTLRVDVLPAVGELIQGLGGRQFGRAFAQLLESLARALGALPFSPFIESLRIVAEILDAIFTLFAKVPLLGEFVAGILAAKFAFLGLAFAMRLSGLQTLAGWIGAAVVKMARLVREVRRLRSAQQGLSIAGAFRQAATGATFTAGAGAAGAAPGAAGAAAVAGGTGILATLAAAAGWVVLLAAVTGGILLGFKWLYENVKLFKTAVDRAADFVGRYIARPIADLLPGEGTRVSRPRRPGESLFDWARNAAVDPRAPMTRGGDTHRPRAARRGAYAFAAHRRIDASVPGHRVITNAWRGSFRGSDHRRGRALDLQGSGLVGYAKAVNQTGGYAAFHGSGADRHLHAAYGDTARPRVAGASERQDRVQFVLNGPLVAIERVESDVDVERAVYGGIERWMREREERR